MGAGGGGDTELRKHSHAHHHERKKVSLPGEKRRISGSSSSLMRRSNSCLSSSSMTSSFREESSTDCSTYLTPTQRKNQEIKKIRLELERANNLLLSKDKEITLLKKEVTALKESKDPSNLQDSWIAETESAADSGNCEEMVSSAYDTEVEQEVVVTNNKMDNIDFELMESALREEEEYRHKLEEDNQELKDQVADMAEEIQRLKESHSDEVSKLKSCHSEDVIDARKESNQKVEELIIELAESSMRCSRQQDTIEQRQLKIDELLKEVNSYKENINKLEDLVHLQETNTKEKDVRINPEYLRNTKESESISCQTDCKVRSDITTQTDEDFKLTLSRSSEINADIGENANIVAESSKKSESTCDNKIHYTYQFLRRSIYYYITDKDNRAYHLKSIQRLLEFSDAELNNMNHIRPRTLPEPVRRY